MLGRWLTSSHCPSDCTAAAERVWQCLGGEGKHDTPLTDPGTRGGWLLLLLLAQCSRLPARELEAVKDAREAKGSWRVEGKAFIKIGVSFLFTRIKKVHDTAAYRLL